MRYASGVDDRDVNLLGALVTAVGDAMRDATETAAGRGGATAAALAVLAQEPDLGIEELRVPLGLSQPATVRIVDRLVDGGLARRGPGRDGRSISVRLSAAGRREAQRVLDRRAEVLRSVTAALSPADQQFLSRVVEQMLSGLTDDRAEADHICRLCDLTSCPLERCPVEQAAGAAPEQGR
jgi:DNA-binding MarR family transcriptional regulator